MLPFWHKLCGHHSTRHQVTVSLHSKPHRVCVCLAVTCHLHFWQNDQDLLCATAVTWGWNGYWNKSQHRKLTPEKKIFPPLLPGLEPGTFRSWVWRSNHWAIPAVPSQKVCAHHWGISWLFLCTALFCVFYWMYLHLLCGKYLHWNSLPVICLDLIICPCSCSQITRS